MPFAILPDGLLNRSILIMCDFFLSAENDHLYMTVNLKSDYLLCCSALQS